MFPIVQYLKKYNAEYLQSDLRAGLTTAIMLIPQSMAYAMLAGLNPVYGLYAATIPTAVYAFFGRGRALAVGPVALDSLLVALAVTPLAGDDVTLYALYATLLMFMMGALQFVMGLIGLGKLSDFLRPPVLVGFTGAAALIIASTQVPTLLGIQVARGAILPVFVWQILQKISEVHLPTLALGITSIVLLSLLKRWVPKLPRHLVVVAVGMILMTAIPTSVSKIKVVGDVPAGLPAFSMPLLSVDIMLQLLGAALTLSLVAFLEAYSVALRTKKQEDPELCPNGELRALGMANLVGSFFQGYPVTGGFSRTAVNDDAGAKTPLAGLFTAGFVVLSLLFLTPLFVVLPKAVLGAIIWTAVIGLIDVSAMRILWQKDRTCWGVMFASAMGTIFLGISWGIGLGALLAFIVEKTRGNSSCVLSESKEAC